MRYIDNSALEKMSSPIRHVMKNLHNAIVNIAPERRDEFDIIHSDFTLVHIDSPKWICSVNTNDKIIQLSRRVVELIWSASYAYIVIYTEHIQGRQVAEFVEIELYGNEKSKRACQLLAWSINNMLNVADVQWPENLPQPQPLDSKDSYEYLANELCYCAMAYILHHELGHIRLNHSANARDFSTVEKEREADFEAARWIIDSVNSDKSFFLKRALGIATALSVLVAHNIHTGNFGDSSHPASYDRLIFTLQRFLEDENHCVWGFVVLILKLHMDDEDISKDLPDTLYDSFFECANDYADFLSTHFSIS